MADPYNVLFLCTGNSARSILAESILRKDGVGRFRSFSAGSQPKGTVHPMALRVLAEAGYPVDDMRSKSWQEFAGAGAPAMDFVFTVCDNAAGEACPIWPGQPMTAHWGIEDPAAVEGTRSGEAGGVPDCLPLHEEPHRRSSSTCRCAASTSSRSAPSCATSAASTARHRDAARR